MLRMKYTVLGLMVALSMSAAPLTHAQSTELQLVLARMQAITLEMQKLQAEFAELLTQAGGATPGGSVLGVSTSASGSVFTHSLTYGETNDDIKRIQTLLATDPDIYPYGVSSGFFGPKTEEAIKNLQTRFNLDPVGAIGPATTALLEGYFKAYPDENFPEGVLSTKPRVLGASTSVTPTTTTTPTPSTALSGNPLKAIAVEFGYGEADIIVSYTNGTNKSYTEETEDEDETIAFLVKKLSLSETYIRAVIDFTTYENSSNSDADEDDAEDALDDADDAIDDAEDEIDEADEDGDDVDWAEDTLDEAKDALEEAEDAFDDEDYDEAVELAEEAEELAEKAIDRIDEEKSSDIDEIDSIVAVISDGEAEIEVVYEDGDDDSFTVDEDDEDDIIEAVADELGLDEEDVEDIIEFEYDYGDLDEIIVDIDEENDKTKVEIIFVGNLHKKFTTSETDEDDIVDEIASRYNLRKSDIREYIEYNYE